ncbi:MAG TPA: response regulator transcription factor [Phycisphaerae bacterium]|nr:response regulator transcription factor [Phycisphaerae bacterium]HNU44382.1 response regulator transcription factor [Phycisphaerae bacterium]
MRVLIVEDQERLRTWLQKGLKEADFVVDAAADGNEGLWYAMGNSYDVIILDLMLPGMDGLSILRRLRQAGRQDQVLILTAKDTVPDRVKGLDLGADDYLVKPFAFEELVARVRALVRRGYGKHNAVIGIGELRIDTTQRRVWRGAQEIELRAMEYKLLEYLARRAGETVSRTEIWDHLYDFGSQTVSNVVDVYIGCLRRKLDRPGEKSLIQTRRGLGYVLGGNP